MPKLRTALFAAILTFASVAAANAATKYNWSFTDQNGQPAGSGTLEMSFNIIATKMTGTLYGQKITFYQNKEKDWRGPIPNGVNIHCNNPVPGESTLQNVPNTTGANYTYDDIYNFENGVTYVGGILISTGKGPTLKFYIIGRDNSNYDINTKTNFFSILPDGSYVSNDGVFAVTPAP